MSLFYKFFKTQLSEEDRVIDHLSRLLNTYQGFGSFLPNLGLGGHAYTLSREKAIHSIKRDIRSNIEQFDKRIQINTIEFIEGNEVFSWRFRIDCTLNLGDNQVICIEMSKNNSQLRVVREENESIT